MTAAAACLVTVAQYNTRLPRQQCRGLIEALIFRGWVRLNRRAFRGSNAAASLKPILPGVSVNVDSSAAFRGSNAAASLKRRPPPPPLPPLPVAFRGSNAAASLKLLKWPRRATSRHRPSAAAMPRPH